MIPFRRAVPAPQWLPKPGRWPAVPSGSAGWAAQSRVLDAPTPAGLWATYLSGHATSPSPHTQLQRLCFTCSQIPQGDKVTGLPTSRTHRGPCQDQERPQLLSEVGHPQAAQPAALRGGLQTLGPKSGLLGSLHVLTAVQLGRAEAAGGISAKLISLPRPRPGPPSLRPQPARSYPTVRSQLNAQRASAILDTSLAPPHRCERPPLRQSLGKLWKQTESLCGC